MRQLTKRQKELLKLEYQKLANAGVHAPSADDLTPTVFKMIDSINPCELFHQNVTRFFDDITFERIINGRQF